MKKSGAFVNTTTLMLLTLATFGGVQLDAKPAKAIVAICAWNPLLIGVGLAATTVGALVGGGGGELVSLSTDELDEMPHGVLGWLEASVGSVVFAAGSLAGFGGFILLNDPGAPALKYVPLSTVQANKLGITAEELDSYNSNLDEINAVENSVEADLNAIKNPTVEDSMNEWQSYRNDLPAPSFSALQKISLQLVRK